MLSQALQESDIGTQLDDEVKEIIMDLQSSPMIPERHDLFRIELPISLDKLLPSIEHTPDLELKPLPDQLKYVYLGDNKTLPVIIAKELTSIQEEKLTNVLRNHKTAIGWTIADIKGTSPSTCMHRILLEDNAKPSRDAQKRLNPIMMDVVKKEILKLLSVGVIYPISDSEWVSPMHVVPKKSRITVIKNQNNELIPTRIQNG